MFFAIIVTVSHFQETYNGISMNSYQETQKPVTKNSDRSLHYVTIPFILYSFCLFVIGSHATAAPLSPISATQRDGR